MAPAEGPEKSGPRRPTRSGYSCNNAAKRREELKDVAAEAEHAKVRTSEWKARAEALAEEKRELRARLEEVQRAAITAREYVMATEMKLDLIEAALQVLDSRTREAAISRA